MPHKCVRCGKINENKNNISSCECGSKLFFFIKNIDISNSEKMNAINSSLTEVEKKKIEQDIYDIIGNELKENSVVFFDIEAINIIGHGKYELDLEKISSGKGLIYKYDEGKYIIDIAEAFNNLSRKIIKKNTDSSNTNFSKEDGKENINPLDLE